MDDIEAITLLKKGDISGLELLVKIYQLKAVRAAYFICRDRSLAEDIVQTAFLKVYEKISQFDAKRPFSPWFMRIVTNDALRACLRGKTEVSLEKFNEANWSEVADQNLENLLSWQEEPLQALERTETDQQLWEAIGRLPVAYRVALVQRYFLNETELEIARKQGVNYSTIRWRIHAARERLRGLIGGVQK